jgi:hypothetical protein
LHRAGPGARSTVRFHLEESMTKKLYNCAKCVAYCCTYDHIPVTEKDIKRLAKHHGVTEAAAKKKFTRYGSKQDPIVLHHTKDPHFETSCMFLDKDTRRCTIYEGRPSICREFPTQQRCGYYEFLKFERDNQDDKDYVAVTN